MSEVVRIGEATLYHGDFRSVLGGVVRGASHVITDPPFEAEAHTMQRRVLGKGITASRDIDNQPLPFPALQPGERDALVRWSAAHCLGWFIAFCQIEAVAVWRDALTAAGAKWRRAGVWVKPDAAPQISGDRPAQGFEAIAMAWCGEGRSRWNGGGKSSVFTFGKHDDGTGHGGAPKFHPTQKPRVLMERIVGLFTNPGDYVLDPFMGSGSTGVACANVGRPFIGVELNYDYFRIACERVDAAHRQQRMFA